MSEQERSELNHLDHMGLIGAPRQATFLLFPTGSSRLQLARASLQKPCLNLLAVAPTHKEHSHSGVLNVHTPATLWQLGAPPSKQNATKQQRQPGQGCCDRRAVCCTDINLQKTVANSRNALFCGASQARSARHALLMVTHSVVPRAVPFSLPATSRHRA